MALLLGQHLHIQNRSLFLRYYSLLQTVLQPFLQSKQLPETSLPVSSENFLSWRKCKACSALSSKFSIHPGHKHFPTRNRLNCTNLLLFFNHSAVDQPWQRSSASPGEPNMCRSPLRSWKNKHRVSQRTPRRVFVTHGHTFGHTSGRRVAQPIKGKGVSRIRR